MYFQKVFWVYNTIGKCQNRVNTTPLKVKQIFIPFMVLFSAGLDAQFQRKNQFWKRSTESWHIVQNMSKFGRLAQKANFGHSLADITGLTASFWKPINTLKPWVQAGRKEPHKQNNFCWPLKGSCWPYFGIFQWHFRHKTLFINISFCEHQ